MSSDSDDDRPIGQVVRRDAPVVASEVSSDSDDAPLSQLLAAKRSRDQGSKVPDDDDSSDSDTPIGALVRKSRPKKAGGKSASTKRKRASSVSTTKSSKSTSTRKSKSATEKSRAAYSVSSDGLLKDQAIARVLCRWSYCMSWPPPGFLDSAATKPPSKDWVAMPGFPGVLVGVMNDATGKVLDNRPKSGRPCYHDLAALPSGEIKALWISAVEKQMADLVAHEGEDALLVGTLKKELKEATKFNAKKADKEFASAGKKRRRTKND